VLLQLLFRNLVADSILALQPIGRGGIRGHCDVSHHAKLSRWFRSGKIDSPVHALEAMTGDHREHTAAAGAARIRLRQSSVYSRVALAARVRAAIVSLGIEVDEVNQDQAGPLMFEQIEQRLRPCTVVNPLAGERGKRDANLLHQARRGFGFDILEIHGAA
jgi:hypothetical protein